MEEKLIWGGAAGASGAETRVRVFMPLPLAAVPAQGEAAEGVRQDGLSALTGELSLLAGKLSLLGGEFSLLGNEMCGAAGEDSPLACEFSRRAADLSVLAWKISLLAGNAASDEQTPGARRPDVQRSAAFPWSSTVKQAGEAAA